MVVSSQIGWPVVCWQQCFFFQNLKKQKIGYFDPDKFFLDNQKKKNRGELTDISAKKEALFGSACVFKITLNVLWMFLSCK